MMILRLFCLTAVILFSLTGCSSVSEPAESPRASAPPSEVSAVPQVEVVETERFRELKQRFETAEARVARLTERRQKLLIVYTEAHPEVKKISTELAKAADELKIAEGLFRAERDKLEYRQKNSPV